MFGQGVSGGAETDAGPRGKQAAMTARPRRSRTEAARFNGRSREGVRLRQLEKQFRVQLGETTDNPVTILAIRRAAELVMLAESKRAAMIRGEVVDLGDLLRLEGVARRAVIDLGLLNARRDSESRESLDEFLERHSASSGDAPDDDGT